MRIYLADNLRLLRQNNKFSLETLASVTGVSRQTVAKWESGDSYPDIANTQKLAAVFHVTMDELVSCPLSLIHNNNFSQSDDKVCGVTTLSAAGDIRLPPIVMQMFDIHPCDKMLLLADAKQGIAIMKCNSFEEGIK